MLTSEWVVKDVPELHIMDQEHMGTRSDTLRARRRHQLDQPAAVFRDLRLKQIGADGSQPRYGPGLIRAHES